MAKYDIFNEMQKKIVDNGYSVNPASRVREFSKVSKLMEMVSAKLVVAGYKGEEYLEKAMLNSTENLCNSWHSYPIESDRIFGRFMALGLEKPLEQERPGEGDGTGGGSGTGGKGDGKGDGDGTGGSPTPEPEPKPEPTPIPDPTGTPIPDPTGTPTPDPTGTPNPTGTPIPPNPSDVKLHTVSYDENGGSIPIPQEYAVDGVPYKVQGYSGSKDGFEFLHWECPVGDGKINYKPDAEIIVTEDITLTAVWKEIEPVEDLIDPPDDPNYIVPAKLWNKVTKIVKWNKAHPGKQKNICLYGPAGTGKTELVIRITKCQFGKDVKFTTAPQMKHELEGFANAQGLHTGTALTDQYEEEGVYLQEEIDRCQPGALIALNAAIANKIMCVPVKGTMHQHPMCTIFATANTNGLGNDDVYNSAKRLDGSTRSRFIWIYVGRDREIELQCAKGDEYLVDFVNAWNEACEKNGFYDDICDYRCITNFSDYLDMGLSVKDAMEDTLFRGDMGIDKLIQMKSFLKGNNKYFKAFKKYVSDTEEAAKAAEA